MQQEELEHQAAAADERQGRAKKRQSDELSNRLKQKRGFDRNIEN